MLCLLVQCLIAWGGSSAQAQSLREPAAAHYDVIALRVEFQPDTTRFTTGDGTFEGPLFPDGLRPGVDPLPHDADYFQAHLAFLEDYVAQVSDGQTTVTTHLLPDVVRVSRSMGAYSPTGPAPDSDEERAKLAALVAEAWASASAQSGFDVAGIDPERTAFVLFHAGVGRDIELIGTTLDKTPQDLPSITFDEQTLTDLGQPGITFNDIPVRNTLVLPRTETRPGYNFVEDSSFLLELSINGLLAASFFNVLGVPDLFNTATGESAIGPFGLMDPLGIFAYSGLFPPEPSAWTKYFLGWTDPVRLSDAGPQEVTLDAAALLSGTQAARADVSPAEYFLVENRNRDPEGDGLVLRVWKDGNVVEQRVQHGDETFDQFSVDGFVGGVVVGVDTYDWALPGGVNDDGEPLTGGVLIWHVDERRLAAGLAGNTVNADPDRRAIDLEEADSAQDLGHPANNPFGPAADQGSPYDYFYRGNPVSAITASEQEVRLYENRFGPDTYPNSNSNEGGPSFVVLDEFSAPGPQMSFVYRQIAESGVAPVLSVDLSPAARTDLDAGSALAAEDQAIVVYDAGSGAVLESGGERPRLLYGSSVMPGVQAGQSLLLARGDDGRYVLLGDRFVTHDTVFFDRRVDLPATLSALAPVSPIAVDAQGVAHILFAGDDTAVRAAVALDDAVEVVDVPQVGRGASLSLDATGAPTVVGTRGAEAPGSRWSFDDVLDVTGAAAFGRDRSGLVGVVPTAGSLWWLLADGSTQRVDPARYAAYLSGDAVAPNPFPVLVDLDGDGRLDVLTTSGTSLVAFTQGGALVAGFPIELEAPSVAQPLIAELSDSGAWSVIVAATNGYVYAYDLGRDGASVAGFPLAVGARVAATPLVREDRLYAASTDGRLKGWTLDRVGRVWWGKLYRDARNTSFAELTSDPGTGSPQGHDRLIVTAETYNWPNPVRDGSTFVRCMTAEDARVQITIVDAAGALVERFEMHVSGGTPAEHVWKTDAPSGLYFARVRATSATGEVDTALVKMAIVR